MRCVGRFNHEMKFQIYKIVLLSSLKPNYNDDEIIRIQNVCTFALKTIKLK